jgi:hypothetical protein
VVVIARGRLQVAGTKEDVCLAGRSSSLEEAFIALHATAKAS